MRIVLASKSPRRREILASFVDEFEIITEDVDESLPSGVHPREGVEILARRKGAAVAEGLSPEALVISSDTLVELSGEALGKPASAEDAVRMLLSLSGAVHNVHTGVAVHYRGRCYSGVSSSEVEFKSMSEAEAVEYVMTGEPMDKAGSYAIQGIGRKFVKEFRGEFDSIVGLSASLTKRLMKEALSDD